MPSEESSNTLKTDGAVAPVEGKPETYPPNLFSGAERRLEFDGKKPGFSYRWFNDDGSNISLAIRSGWVLVERKDVKLHSAATPLNNDIGSHVREHVGNSASGGPMYAYLMEKPDWLIAQQESPDNPASREAYHRQLEEQIMAGTLAEKPGEMRYSAGRPYPGSTGSLPRISIRKTNR